MINLLRDVIAQTFEERVGRDEIQKAAKRQNPRGECDTPKCLRVSFKLRVDHAIEEGYRHLDIVIFAPHHYVGVYTRERWDTIAIADMEDDDGELVPKRGKDYTKGASTWKRYSYHDSCWRSDGIERILLEYEDKIVSFADLSFYSVKALPAELLEGKCTKRDGTRLDTAW